MPIFSVLHHPPPDERGLPVLGWIPRYRAGFIPLMKRFKILTSHIQYNILYHITYPMQHISLKSCRQWNRNINTLMNFDHDIFYKNIRGIKIPYVCDGCGGFACKSRRDITIAINRNQTKLFCSKNCIYLNNTFSLCECLECHKTFTKSNKEIKRSPNHFCCHSCSATFHNKNRTKIKKTDIQNMKIKIARRKIFSIKYCINCNQSFITPKRKTCSLSCELHMRQLGAQRGGRASVKTQSAYRRSKNEILFAEKCSLLDDTLSTNEAIFNGWDADIILPKYKVAILWNGAWHYKKITKKHSVLQVQNRDKIKTDEIIKTGFIPYVIKDMGKYNPIFVQEQFDIFDIWLKMKNP